jgi:hypothetical protein
MCEARIDFLRRRVKKDFLEACTLATHQVGCVPPPSVGVDLYKTPHSRPASAVQLPTKQRCCPCPSNPPLARHVEGQCEETRPAAAGHAWLISATKNQPMTRPRVVCLNARSCANHPAMPFLLRCSFQSGFHRPLTPSLARCVEGQCEETQSAAAGHAWLISATKNRPMTWLLMVCLNALNCANHPAMPFPWNSRA